MTQPSFIVSDSYEDLFEQGGHCIETGQFDEAKAIFERLDNRMSRLSDTLFARRPELKRLHLSSVHGLAILAARDKAYDQAQAHYQRLLTMTPPENHADWQLALAQIKIDQGQVEAGLDELRVLAVTNPDDMDVWYTLGRTLFDQKDYGEAETSLKRAAEFEGDEVIEPFMALMFLFDIYKAQKRFAEAEQTWHQVNQRAGKKKGEEVQPLARMYLEAGEWERAAYWIEREKNPYMQGLNRGQLARAQGNEKEALAHWQKTANKLPKPTDKNLYAWAEAALHVQFNPQQIVDTITPALDEEAVLPRTFLMLAVAQIRAGEPEQARETLLDMISEWEHQGAVNSKLSYVDWTLFRELVGDEAACEPFQAYFELVEEE